MLTLREVMIMNTILNDASVTIESLAEKFNLSKRTIRYDLENIEGTLFEQKVLPSYINVMKDLNESNRLTIKAFLKSLNLSSVNLSADERYLIVKYTLILLGKLNITKLSKELHVSRMTVKNDYDTVLKELRLLGLGTKLNYKDGFKLIGEEEIIRGLQLEILNDISKSHYYNELLYSDLKRKVFKDFDFEGIDSCLYALQRELGNIFSDQSYTNLKNFISIALLRNRAGNTLPEAERLLSETDGHYELLTEVNTVIKKYYASELNSAELNELRRHILKSKYIKASDYANDYSIEIDQFVFKLIFTFSQHYGVDLSKDGELFEGLITHLRPLILNQHTLGYEQDIMEEIKSEFSNVYENVEGSLDMLDIPFAEEIIRHEVPFITVHFAAALQRNSLETQINKRILIVCSQGIGVSKLLEQRLTNYFNAEVIDVIPFHYLEHYPRIQSVDLIVTTIGIEKPPMELPAVKVNAVLTSQDLNNLEKEGIIRRNRKIELSKLVDLISPNLKTSINDELVEALKSHFGSFIVDDLSGSKQNDSRQIKKEFIQLVESVSNWEEAIRIALTPLEADNYVTEKYCSEVTEAFRKNGTYMFIGEGIALPHARSNHVMQTGFSVLQLKKPVKYTDELSIKLLICFSSEDNMNHLETLISLVDHIKSASFTESLKTVNTADELADQLLSMEL